MQIREWINRGIGFGLLVSVGVCLVGAAIGAWAIGGEILNEGAQGWWTAAIWLLAAFAGGRTALKRREVKRLLFAVEQAILLFGIIWSAALLADIKMNFGGNGVYITICIVGGTMLAAILPMKKMRKKRKRDSARKLSKVRR